MDNPRRMHHIKNDTVIEFKKPETIKGVLIEVMRSAPSQLAAAIEAQVAELLAAHNIPAIIFFF